MVPKKNTFWKKILRNFINSTKYIGDIIKKKNNLTIKLSEYSLLPKSILNSYEMISV